MSKFDVTRSFNFHEVMKTSVACFSVNATCKIHKDVFTEVLVSKFLQIMKTSIFLHLTSGILCE